MGPGKKHDLFRVPSLAPGLLCVFSPEWGTTSDLPGQRSWWGDGKLDQSRAAHHQGETGMCQGTQSLLPGASYTRQEEA